MRENPSQKVDLNNQIPGASSDSTGVQNPVYAKTAVNSSRQQIKEAVHAADREKFTSTSIKKSIKTGNKLCKFRNYSHQQSKAVKDQVRALVNTEISLDQILAVYMSLLAYGSGSLFYN